MYLICTNKQDYIERIEGLKREQMATFAPHGKPHRVRNAVRMLRKGQFGKFRKACAKRWKRMVEQKDRDSSTVPNYFSDERIAVYTVVFGNYDVLYEPRFVPDNCDFFLISDQVIPSPGSVWKKWEVPSELREMTEGMSDVLKNRFFKMHPQLLFPDYNYSVYLDGNVQMITDPTEFINDMPECGLSLHLHSSRSCVFQEATAILAQQKATETQMQGVLDFLRSEDMPEHYGLLECNVIVRRHNQETCIELMQDWWNLFMRYPYRDQMFLPYVLYKHGIRPDEIANLGKNVRKSPSFRYNGHVKI